MLCKLLACGVIGTAMHRRVYKHPTNTMIRGPWGRRRQIFTAALLQTKPAISLAAEVRHGHRWRYWTTEQRRIYRHPLHSDKQCCGSGMFIPDPGSWFLPIPDPGSKNSNKREGWKKLYVKPFYVATKFNKIVNYFSFEVLKKKIWANFQRIIELFTKKIV